MNPLKYLIERSKISPPQLCGEEHPDQTQKYYDQQEHRYPICTAQSSDGLKELFHCNIISTKRWLKKPWNLQFSRKTDMLLDRTEFWNDKFCQRTKCLTETCLISEHRTFAPALEFLSEASLVNPIGNMPPSSLRTTVKWLRTPGLFHSEGNMGESI